MRRVLSVVMFLCLRTFASLPEGKSSEETALLRAIIAHPDEDTPRLVYADWLQEHDNEEQAEFIRLQVGIATGVITDPDKLVRSKALEKKQLGQLATSLRTPTLKVRFIRGFPEEIIMPRELFINPLVLRRALEAAPFLRSLGVTSTNQVHSIAEQSIRAMIHTSVVDVTERLTSLTLMGLRVEDDLVPRLAPHLRSLREIAADRHVMTRNGLIALLNSEVGPRLHRIDIEGDWYADWGSGFDPGEEPPHPIRLAFSNLAPRNPELRGLNMSLHDFLPDSMRSVWRMQNGLRCREMVRLLAD